MVVVLFVVVVVLLLFWGGGGGGASIGTKKNTSWSVLLYRASLEVVYDHTA